MDAKGYVLTPIRIILFLLVLVFMIPVFSGAGYLTETLGGGVEEAADSSFVPISAVTSLLLLKELTADFGDLDDTTFPTKKRTDNTFSGRTGPYHIDVTHEWIGNAASSTTDKETDAKVIDNDFDDGVIHLYKVNSCGVDCSIGMFSVGIGTDSDPAIRYLNVAADFNHDGHFAMYPAGSKFQHEWLIRNLPVLFVGKQGRVGSSFRIVDPLALMTIPCVRMTLATEMVDPAEFGPMGWDGSGPVGGFSRGETEDQCPQNSSIPFPVQLWPVGSGVRFPVYTHDPPAVPFPIPNGPYVDEPGGPIIESPPPAEIKDLESYPPETAEEEDASKPFVEPAGTSSNPFLYEAIIADPDMVDNKQTGDNDCMPTAAANSIEYLLKKAGINSGIDHEGWKSIMSPAGDPPDGMMDVANGEGTTVKGYRKGKSLASNALSAEAKTIRTERTENPSFMNIYNAVNEGKDVEIAISYQISTPPEGHMVVVTGATMDHNGNMTLTFVDPGNEEAGEQTYTITNGAPAGSDEIKDRGGLKVNNYPGAKEKTALIEFLFVEELADVVPPG